MSTIDSVSDNGGDHDGVESRGWRLLEASSSTTISGPGGGGSCDVHVAAVNLLMPVAGKCTTAGVSYCDDRLEHQHKTLKLQDTQGQDSYRLQNERLFPLSLGSAVLCAVAHVHCFHVSPSVMLTCFL
jgi:hypothetical protein